MADDARLAIVLEANIDKLNAKLDQANAKVAGFAKKAAHDLDEADSRWSKLFGKSDPGEALEKVFSRSRLAVFEEGAAKIPVFGSAIEALGPAGLAGAAGLAVLGIAAEQTRKAMEWADDLDRTAKKLGVTTDSLQELDYATISFSVGQEKGREALERFNEVFGKYSAGLAPGKVSKFLDALGFTPESAREVTDVGGALEKVLPKLAAIRNPSQRAALASSFGLTDFLPVVAEGAEGVEKFIAKLREAKAVGAVISPEQIQRAAELNDQVEALQYRIGQDLRAAFIDLAPAIEGAFELLAKFVHLLRDVGQAEPQAAAAIGQLVAQATGKPRAQAAGMVGKAAGFLSNLIPVAGPALAPFVQSLVTMQANPAAPLAAKPAPSVGARGVDLSKPEAAKAKTDDAARKAEEARKASDDAIADAQKRIADAAKAELSAREALTDDIDALAAFAAQQVELAAQEKDAEAAKKELDLRHKEKLGQVVAGTADYIEALDLAAAFQRGIADSLKLQKIARDAELEKAQKDLAYREEIDRYLDQVLQVQSSLARTTAERREVELRILAVQQQELERRLKVEHDANLTRIGTSPDQQGARDAEDSRYRSVLGASRDANRAQVTSTLHANMDPLAAWADKAPKTAQEIGEAVETYAVKAFDSLNEGIGDAIANGKSMGDVFKSEFADMEKALISYLLKQAEIGVIGALFGAATPSFNLAGLAGPKEIGALPSLPKFADGGFVGGAGGPRSDSVLARLSPGEFVLSNAMMTQLSRPVPTRGGGGDVHISYAPAYNVQGSGPELAALRAQMEADQASFGARAKAAVQDGLARGQITPGRR